MKARGLRSIPILSREEYKKVVDAFWRMMIEQVKNCKPRPPKELQTKLDCAVYKVTKDIPHLYDIGPKEYFTLKRGEYIWIYYMGVNIAFVVAFEVRGTDGFREVTFSSEDSIEAKAFESSLSKTHYKKLSDID